MVNVVASKDKKSSDSSSRKKKSSGVSSRSKTSRSGKSQKSKRSEKFDESSRRIKSRDARRRRSRSRKKKSCPRQCSMLSRGCPNRISHDQLMQTAANDRRRREDATFAQMVKAFDMTEIMVWRAMERQNANLSMRGLALYLELVCVVILGIMGVLAQHYFNTRGELHYYLIEMTFEMFLFLIVILNITTPGLGTRLTSIGIFVFAVGVNLCHILSSVRSKGTFFKCEASEIMLQHCFLKLIPTHYHTLYMSSLLLVLHLAIVLILVSAAIFHDASLCWYLENTPGAPQWVTSEPLHEHDRVEQRKRLKAAHWKPDAGFSLSDLPFGTYVIREQSEQSVKVTAIEPSGKRYVGPEDVTITRSYTLDVPGAKRITGRRSWKKRNPPKPASTSSKSTKVLPASAKSEKVITKSVETKPSVKTTDMPLDSTPTKRIQAGKDAEPESEVTYMSRMPPLTSRIAYLNNKNLIQKQSDYMY